MRLSLRTLSALAFAASIPFAAHADTFTFQVTGSVTGAGTITAIADPSLAGAYDVTSITGTYDGQQISLLPCAAYDVNNACENPIQHTSFSYSFFFDNLLYFPTQPYLDFDGIGFSVGSAGDESSFFYVNAGSGFTPGYNYFDNSNNFGVVDFTVQQVASTPEPDSLILVATGLLGAFSSIRRRRMSRP